MKKRTFTRGLCFALCLCMLMSSMVASAFAVDSASADTSSKRPAVVTADPSPTAYPETKEMLWEFDFSAMNGKLVNSYQSDVYGTVNLTSKNFTLNKEGMKLSSGSPCGTIWVKEPMTQTITSAANVDQPGNSFIAACDGQTMLLTTVVRFDSLPVVTSNTRLLSFITWEHKYYKNVGNSTTDTSYARFLCVDEHGNLYDNDRDVIMSDTKRLEAGKETEITIVLMPTGSTCLYDLYFDGEYVFSSSVPIEKGVSGIVESSIRICDTQRKYDVTVKKLSLETVEEGFTFGKVDTADWRGYQTTKVTKNAEGKDTFDLRLVSLVKTIEGYSTMGYEVTKAYRENGEDMEEVFLLSGNTLYTEINQNVNGKTVAWRAADNGSKYIMAAVVEDMDASQTGYELRVRPFAVRADGLRIYGKSQYLAYSGLGSDGRPRFICSDASSSQTVYVKDDTYVRFGSYANDNYDTAAQLQYKWSSLSTDILSSSALGAYTRFTYLRFDLSDLSDGWGTYYLSLTYSKGKTDYNTCIYEVDELKGVDFSTLTGTEVKKNPAKYLESGKLIKTFYLTRSNIKIDITDIILEAKEAGKKEVVWRLQYDLKDVEAGKVTDYNEAILYSKENGDPGRAPSIIGAGSFNYETNLDTYGNAGYEPWGYAELMVKDWNENIWDIYSRDYGYSIMDGKEDADSKAYVAQDYSIDLTVTNGSGPVSGNENMAKVDGSKVKTIKARTTETIYGYDALYTKPDYDGYGGLAADGGKYYSDPTLRAKVNGTKGYFGTYYDDKNNRWWLITPEGNRFLALGICTVTTGSTTAQKALAQTAYGNQTGEEWTVNLLNKIGLNTSTGSAIPGVQPSGDNYMISTHSGVGLLSKYADSIGVNVSVGGSTIFANNKTLNVFDPDFVPYAYNRAASVIGDQNTAPYMFGWTSDNEIPADKDMLIRYLTADSTVDPTVVDDPATKHENEKDDEALKSRAAYSYAVAWTWLRAVTGKANPSLSDAYGIRMVNMGGEVKEVSYFDLFRGFVYYRYYGIASAAVKAAAPNQLYLGCRELGGNYQCETVMRAAGVFCDVITLNLYLGANPSAVVIDNIHKWAGIPAYVTEFYSKSQGVDARGNQSGTQSYGIWEVKYPSLVSPSAATYYTADTVKTTVSGGKAKDTYYDGNVALWTVEYAASGATAGTKSVSISAYVAKGGTEISTYYIANGKTTYRDADGAVKTVPEIILTNYRGAGKLVRSQEDRGVYYETFALKMLESGFCVGWSWFRYQDNDMGLFTDANGNLVYFNDWIDDYRYWADGDKGLTLIHRGEITDQSSLDANKGIVNNAMEEYTEFTSHIAAIANNIYGLAEHFDQRRN